MARFLFFNVLFLACIGYALIRGGKPERIVALTFIGAVILSGVLLRLAGSYYRKPEYGTLLVDGMVFAILLWVALTADRYWPIFVAAMQGVSLLGHVGKLLAYDIGQNTYLNAVQLWAYPQLLLLALGTVRVDLRARQKPAGWWPSRRTDFL